MCYQDKVLHYDLFLFFIDFPPEGMCQYVYKNAYARLHVFMQKNSSIGSVYLWFYCVLIRCLCVDANRLSDVGPLPAMWEPLSAAGTRCFSRSPPIISHPHPAPHRSAHAQPLSARPAPTGGAGSYGHVFLGRLEVLTVTVVCFSQVAVKVDSVESQERLNPIYLPPLSPAPLSPHFSSPSSLPPPPPSSPSALSLPSAFSLSPPSPLPLSLLSSPSPQPPATPSLPSLLLPPPPPSPRLPLRHSSLRRPRPPSATSLCDAADEEVYHITSSACHRWKDEEGQESIGKSGRSHSLSPYTSPYSPDSNPPLSPAPPSPPCSSSRSTLNLPRAGLKDRDFRKGFSADNQAFLDKPSSLSAGYLEDQRRHSIEVCLPQALTTNDDQRFTQEAHRSDKGGQAFPARVKSVGGGHRKKKMSPPCISIHPPSEREHPQIASPPKLAECSMMLRRRTPSYDLTPHSRSSAQDTSADMLMQSPMHTPLTPIHVPLHSSTHTLTPSQASTPTHPQTYTPPNPSTPTHPHIPISPNIFIQPHAPLFPNAMPFSQPQSLSPAARQSPHTGDYIPLPQFTFDQPQSRYMSGLSAGLSDTETPACSSPFDNRLGSGGGFSAKNRRTAQWTSSIAFRKWFNWSSILTAGVTGSWATSAEIGAERTGEISSLGQGLFLSGYILNRHCLVFLEGCWYSPDLE